MSRQTKYFPFKGGLNTEDPPLSIPSGELIDCLNYEPNIRGGYTRIQGYERFDGHPLASESEYHTVSFSGGSNEPLVNDVIAGLTSGATAAVLAVVVDSGSWAGNDAVGYLALKLMTGAFVTAETIEVVVGHISVGTTTSSSTDRGAPTDELDVEYWHTAIEYCRSAVGVVPGSGVIRGVWMFNGTTYAFRDNVAGTECVMYKSTATGWVVVTTPTLTAGGRYEFINYNFKASVGSEAMYGCDGVNKGFVFDGSTYTEITTGMTLDAPQHLIAHKMHLFYSFAKGSVQHSAPGDPATWSVVVGAGEMGLGQECTGFVGVPGEALQIFGRNGTWILNGATALSWSLNSLDNEAGAIEWTIQGFKYPIYVDDNGITGTQAVQAYGDFKANSLSQKVERLITTFIKEPPLASIKIRSKNQYRVFFANGRCLTMVMNGTKNAGITVLDYGIKVRCTASVEDSTGQEILLFGSDDGYVYRMDSGNSFDGNKVDAYIRPAFNHFGSPENKKRFFKATVEMEASGPSDIYYLPSFSYGGLDLPSAGQGTLDIHGGGGIWDSVNTAWNSFYWDAQLVDTAECYIDGVGKNMSLLIRSSHTYEEPHSIQGIIIHFSVRGISR